MWKYKSDRCVAGSSPNNPRKKEKTIMKEKGMRTIMTMAISLLCLCLAACASTPVTQSEKEEQKDSLRAMASQTLAQLYNKNPAAKSAISNAAGYAVFSDFGFKLSFMGGAKGKGVAINNTTKHETFMKMMELQPGMGLGADKFRVVLVFENSAAFNTFVTSGWEAGANAMMAAKSKTAGGALAGAVTVSEGVYMYQITEEGLIVGVSITGAKYSKDAELN
jgi:lipid-binding SYLF domain-containing protein